MKNDDVLAGFLPRLIAEYERGTLVPFVGAGITFPNCVLWEEFIHNLEVGGGIREGNHTFRPSNDTPARLVQRAERAVRRIRHNPTVGLAEVVGNAIASPKRRLTPPPATAALSEIAWPLIITTNYDDWLLYEINRPRENKSKEGYDFMQVCGRGRADTERVINSLRSPDQPLLWAIQGFVGGQAPGQARFEPFPGDDLSDQLVVGHEEYRREAFRSIGFRRAFAEVFRNRSLLFIGSGLSESYFENLFDETLELQGAVGHNHYAFVEEGKLNLEVLRGRFQIEAIEYPAGEHNKVVEWLKTLKNAIVHRTVRCAGWHFNLESKSLIDQNDAPDLQVIRSCLPNPKNDECVVISAGFENDGDPKLSRSGREVLQQCLPSNWNKSQWMLLRTNPHIWRFGKAPVFAVAARDSKYRGRDSRDSRAVKETMPHLMELIANEGFSRLYCMLLAAGEGRVFPPHVSLLQMARGFADWKHQGNHKASLVICVVDPRPLALLASGKLNLHEVLSVPQTRFWLEIQRPGTRQVTRHLVHEDPSCLIKEIATRYDLCDSKWSAWVLPSPVAGEKVILAKDILSYAGKDPWTVENAGLLPGSTLRVLIDPATK